MAHSKLYDPGIWQAFLSVAMVGSMNKASFDLEVDVSTVSRRIDFLEASLGYKLFIRKSRQCILTTEGEAALKKIAPIMLQFTTTVQGINETPDTIQGTVRVKISCGLTSLVMGWLAEFQSLYPNVMVEVGTFTGQSQPVDNCDLAIIASQMEQIDVDAINLGRVSTFICASKTYLSEHGPICKIQDLENHRIVINSAWACPSLIYDPLYNNAYHHGSAQRFRVDSMTALKEAALEGIGVVIGLPRYLCDKEIKAGKLVRLFEPMESLSLHFFLVTPYKNLRPLRVEKCVDFLRRKWVEGMPYDNPIGRCCVL